MQYSEITSPTLLLDAAKAKRNIRRVAEKMKQNNILFRPHFKTPQSAAVCEWFREEGVSCCTVSSLKMAEYFAGHGWKDITLAMPVNLREKERLFALAKRIQFHVIFDDLSAFEALNTPEPFPGTIWLEVDCGYPRSGVKWEDETSLQKVAAGILASGVKVEGILTHAGHTYMARGRDEIRKVHDEALQHTLQAKASLERAGLPPLKVSFGDTPGASVVDVFPGVDEMRPGNFIFYDMQQAVIGSCVPEDIAVALFVPVVAVHPERGEVIVHGGGVHLSKDSYDLPDGRTSFGAVALPLDKQDASKGWAPPTKDIFVRRATQEHGIISAGEAAVDFKPGDFLLILPPHSCLTADAMGSYLTLEGERMEMMR